jgi:NADH-quinone oxidoreductase subunit A
LGPGWGEPEAPNPARAWWHPAGRARDALALLPGGTGHRRDDVATLASMEGYAAVAAVVLAGILLVTAAMIARRMVAPRAVTEKGLRTYESGVDPVGVGWAQSQIRYISFAFLYVVFAVDAVYLFPWALVIRDPDLGVASLVEVAVFVGVILVGLVHAGRRGLLRWTT